jgi:hypothetical protein
MALRIRFREELDMNDTTRIVLIALGIALLVAVLLPLLFMAGMMSMMGGMMSMMNGTMGNMMSGQCCGAVPWVMGGLVLLVLVVGVVLLAVGLRR